MQTGPVLRSSLSRQSEDQTICGSPEKNLEKVEMEVVLSLYWGKAWPKCDDRCTAAGYWEKGGLMEVRDKSVFKGQVGGTPAEGAFERLSICLWPYPLTIQPLTRLPPSSWLAIYLFIYVYFNCATELCHF